MLINLAASLLSTGFSPVEPQTSYFGLFLQGKKIGYASYISDETTYQGQPATKSTSKTQIKIGLIGSEVEMSVVSETISVKQKPAKMYFSTTSAGRTQIINAWFEAKTIRVEVDNSGTKSKQTLALPTDGSIVDDPVTEFALNPSAAGAVKNFYVFDPTTVSLIKNSAQMIGSEEIESKGMKVKANVIQINDPRLTTKVFLSGKGDVIKVSSSLGIEMVPVTKDEAMTESTDTGNQPDLAELTRITPSRSITSPDRLSLLKIRLSADNLPAMTSDVNQVVARKGDTWEITHAPKQLKSEKTASIVAAAKAAPSWTKPSLNMPSDAPKFKALAKQIVGNKKDVKSAALAIRSYVNQLMTPNAGIGVLRDATEVLATKEGVCRDYAILTATLCRSAGIPTRLASGLVSWDGNFYYHAWVEVYNGFNWLGMDSIPPTDQFSASHVKLSQGNVDKAFNFTVLSNAHMEVLETKN